ncbi:MAG: hypothetical protein A2138_02400 [Deltaproteobacteria bacterium RBG_16_71_12]|nr:MAG: hypothetical protein A2138_02400 [Deltaproteobacteria bacterium RBG_16_71_12]
MRTKRLGLRDGARATAPDLAGAGVIGTSEAMRELRATIERVAHFRANTLLLGESGAGKELVARALHARGPRRRRLFVPVNCATLGSELLENELFGHERGAFAGAVETKKGLFELADGGTLFLDQIDEMEPSTQAKLLRALERSEFRRVGGTTKLRVDLSIIAASNRDLPAAIAAGRFRADLYYRLKVVTIALAPLRDRREDIPALVEAFVADFNRRHGAAIKGVAPAAMTVMMAHSWPGNVRELKNVIESASVMSDGVIVPADAVARALRSSAQAQLPIMGGDANELRIQLGTSLQEVERMLIGAVVARSRSRAEAARRLGIGERTLYTKLRALRAAGGV